VKKFTKPSFGRLLAGGRGARTRRAPGRLTVAHGGEGARPRVFGVRARGRTAPAREDARRARDTHNSNDPSAGSPTETLLRLLLPLNGRVRSFSRTRRRPSARGRRTTRVQSGDLTAVVQSVVATGGVYKGQGRNQRELMTHAYWEFLVHVEKLQATIPKHEGGSAGYPEACRPRNFNTR
jgi:hypothetical protein